MNMDLSTRYFRTVCGRFATGVTVLLTETSGVVHGMTANAFMSVSLDPLLVAVSVHHHGRMAALLNNPGTPFSLSVLAADQQRMAEYFGRPGAQRPINAARDLIRVERQTWMVKEALAWISCRVDSVQPAGDHALVLAKVDACDLDTGKTPLVFYAGHYWEHLDRERDNPIEWQLLEL